MKPAQNPCVSCVNVRQSDRLFLIGRPACGSLRSLRCGMPILTWDKLPACPGQSTDAHRLEAYATENYLRCLRWLQRTAYRSFIRKPLGPQKSNRSMYACEVTVNPISVDALLSMVLFAQSRRFWPLAWTLAARCHLIYLNRKQAWSVRINQQIL